MRTTCRKTRDFPGKLADTLARRKNTGAIIENTFWVSAAGERCIGQLIASKPFFPQICNMADYLFYGTGCKQSVILPQVQ
jgi:hypothetical protein